MLDQRRLRTPNSKPTMIHCPTHTSSFHTCATSANWQRLKAAFQRPHTDIAAPPTLPCRSQARNVLLQSCASEPRGFLAKIGDFGLSHKMEAEETHISKLFQGTPTHMAPEVFLLGHQSKGADA